MAHAFVGGDYAAHCLNPLTLTLSQREMGLHGPYVRGRALRGSLLKPPHPSPLPRGEGIAWPMRSWEGITRLTA